RHCSEMSFPAVKGLTRDSYGRPCLYQERLFERRSSPQNVEPQQKNELATSPLWRPPLCRSRSHRGMALRDIPPSLRMSRRLACCASRPRFVCDGAFLLSERTTCVLSLSWARPLRGLATAAMRCGVV